MSVEFAPKNPAVRRRTWLRRGALAAVVLVPLAFAGLAIGALSNADSSLERIPVAIVNEDSLIMTKNMDGTETPVFAGRLLVTELTGDTEGFDWTITNADEAESALDRGEVYAILTIPSDFSRSVLSLSSPDPRKADISIRTDDAHSYLTGSVAQEVGQSMTATFGNEITAQYIGGIYANIGDLGTSLGDASAGAGELADGATGLASGLTEYTTGVSDLADGLDELDAGAAGLSQLSSGVASYTQGISQLSATLGSINGTLQSNATIDPVTLGTLQAVVDGLAASSTGGAALSGQVSGAISGIQSGIAQSADGAGQLADGSPELTSGATQLASGATELSTGLAAGAGQVPAFDPTEAESAADIAADPVGLSVETDNEVTDIGQAIATFFVPLGLWIGALAVFLVLAPVSRRALASTADNGRLVLAAIVRAGGVAAAQALVLVALLHGALGVAWTLLPATIAFSLVMALSFTAFHHFLTVALGRAGLVVSLFLLAVQLTSTGGLYPVQVLGAPFQAISPYLPLTYAVSGMQAIIAGSGAGEVVVAALVLAAFGALSGVLALAAIRRTRRAGAIGLTPRTA